MNDQWLEKSSLPEELKREIRERLRAQEIWCPFCGAEQDQDMKYRFVSYWGEDGKKECTCRECDGKFYVEEKVERTFVSTKTMEEEDGM